MPTEPSNEAFNERRRSLRREFHANLEIDWGSAVLTGKVRDISPRGLFIELIPALWVGATFRARLKLNPALPLDCTVARVEPQNGVAVEFEIADRNGKAQLDALLSSLSKA